MEVELKCDNQSAVDFCRKTGLGKSKHINTGLLWLQDAVESHEVKLVKVHTDSNLADVMTMYLTAEKRKFFLNAMGMGFQSGQHPLVLRA